MAQSIQLIEATKLLTQAYQNPTALRPLLVHKRPQFAQSYLLADRTLVIPGINERADRLAALNQLHVPGSRYGWSRYSSTISNAIWIAMFCQYAFEVVRVFHPYRPRIIIGHSLGAGVAQIVAHYYDCPAICFATPAVKSHRGPSLPDRLDVLNVLTKGDWLPALLPHGPVVKRIGQTFTVPVTTGSGNPHSMKSYVDAVKAAPSYLPTKWDKRL